MIIVFKMFINILFHLPVCYSIPQCNKMWCFCFSQQYNFDLVTSGTYKTVLTYFDVITGSCHLNMGDREDGAGSVRRVRLRRTLGPPGGWALGEVAQGEGGVIGMVGGRCMRGWTKWARGSKGFSRSCEGIQSCDGRRHVSGWERKCCFCGFSWALGCSAGVWGWWETCSWGMPGATAWWWAFFSFSSPPLLQLRSHPWVHEEEMLHALQYLEII